MNDELPNNERLMKKQGLIYPELSYKIIGLVYKVNDEIGFGQSERVYGDALENFLSLENIRFERELYCPIKIAGNMIAKRYFDFLIDDKIILELKIGDFKYKEVCSQLFQYLKLSGKKLGIIARFTRNGVRIKRIPCFY